MSFQLPEPIFEVLMSKLGNDDAFRAIFIADARQALINLGFGPAADSSLQNGIWNCMSVSELASKDAIRASHGLLRQQLVAQRASHCPIALQVGPAIVKAA